MAAADDFDADLGDDEGLELDSADIDDVISAEDADDDESDADLDDDDKDGDTATDKTDDDETDDADPELDEEDEEEGEESLEVLLGQDEKATKTKSPRAVPSAVTATVGEGEFTCRSCFLVKRRAQLADEDKMICFDCA